MSTPISPAGWYPDPEGGPGQRYWDGAQWAAPTPPPAPSPPTDVPGSATQGAAPPPAGAPVPGGSAPAPRRRRTWLIVLIVILAVVLLFAGGCAVLFAVVVGRNAPDPASNSQTGLADGAYVLLPSTSVILGSNCSYGGDVYDRASGERAGNTRVVGTDAADCALGSDAQAVYFEVRGGVASIVQVD